MGTSPYLNGNGGNGMGKSWYLMISPAKQFLMTVKLMSRISELSAENTNHLRFIISHTLHLVCSPTVGSFLRGKDMLP
jgi:hypothetical protein